MPLTYRAMLVPTAAIDSTGNAKPNATFTVTPLAGGSPVDVFADAQGGTALSAGAVKSDVAGNISGLYVDEPGAYVLAFAGGVNVVTSAITDPRNLSISDPAHVLVLDRPLSLPAQGVIYDDNGAPTADGVWRASATPTWIEIPDVMRQEGSAINYTNVDYPIIEYTADGVYLSCLYLQLVPVQENVPLPADPPHVMGWLSIADQQVLSFVARSPDGAFDFVQTTWMSVQSAGDTNSLPYIEKVESARPYAIKAARYTVVKLAA